MEGVPGRRQDAAGAHPRRRAVGRDPAGAVHARPDAGRHHRLDGDRQPAGRAQLPRGPALHQPAAGRRDQPDAAEDPVRAARGDGGGPGLGRRRLARRCPRRSWSPRRRTRSSTKAPTRCPRPSSTGSCSRWCCRSRSARPSWRSCAGTPPASTRATSPAPGSPPVAGAADIAAGQAAVARVQVSPEVAGYIVDIARATRQSPSLSLGVSPRGATALLRVGPGLGLADRPRLRHPRRRQGARPRDPRAPARAASRGRARGRRRRAGARLRARLGAGPAVTPRTDGAPPGRVPLLLAAGPGPGGAAAQPWARSGCGCSRSGCWSLADWLLAPAPGRGLARAARRSARCGSGTPPRRVLLVATNDRAPGAGAGPRRVAADRRRQRQPAPGPTRPRRPGARCGPRCCPRRRGDLRAVGVTVRTRGPLGPGRAAAHPRGRRARSARCRPSSRASTCRAGWPGSASSTAGRRSGCAARARSSTRCASTSAATTCARSTGGPAPATATWWCAPGSRSATGGWCWCSTPRAPRPGRRRGRAAARLRDGRRAAARRARRPRRRPDRLRRRRPAGPGPAAVRRRAATSRRACRTRWPTSSRSSPRPTGPSLAGAVSGFGRQRALVVLLTPLEPSAVEEGLLPVLPALTRHHRVVLASVQRPGARAAGGDARHRSTRCTTPRPPSRCCVRRQRTADLLARARRRRGRRRRRAPAARALADHYLDAEGARPPRLVTAIGHVHSADRAARSGLGGDAVLEQGGVDVAGVAAVDGGRGRARTRRRGTRTRRGRRSRSGPRSAGRTASRTPRSCR